MTNAFGMEPGWLFRLACDPRVLEKLEQYYKAIGNYHLPKLMDRRRYKRELRRMRQGKPHRLVTADQLAASFETQQTDEWSYGFSIAPPLEGQ